MTKVRVLAYRSKTMANKRQFQIYTPEMAVHLRNNKIYYYIFTRLENKEDAKKYIYPAIRCFKTLFPKTYDRQNIRIVTLDLYLLDMPLLAPPVEFDPDHEKPQSEDTIYEDMPPLEPASPVLHSSSISFNIDQNIVPLDKAPSSGETTPRPPSTDVANDPQPSLLMKNLRNYRRFRRPLVDWWLKPPKYGIPGDLGIPGSPILVD